jgi:hypothetical protein
MKTKALQVVPPDGKAVAPIAKPQYADFDRFVKLGKSVAADLARLYDALDAYAERPEKATPERIEGCREFLDRIKQQTAEWKSLDQICNSLTFYEDNGNGLLKRRIIEEQVALLLGSFPNAGPHNPAVYSGMLVEEIVAAEPCAVALEATCREIRRTKNFAPTIAEVLKILKEKNREAAEANDACLDDGDTSDYFARMESQIREAESAYQEARTKPKTEERQ